jgi:hypothetical protein
VDPTIDLPEDTQRKASTLWRCFLAGIPVTVDEGTFALTHSLSGQIGIFQEVETAEGNDWIAVLGDPLDIILSLACGMTINEHHLAAGSLTLTKLKRRPHDREH